MLINFRYYGNSHMQRRSPTYGKNVHDVTKQTIFRKYTETRADRSPGMTVDEELFMKCAKILKRLR